MGKNKQPKEKKFDRNVEISAPILDPEIIKAIHSPPRGQRLDLKHGGFKALLSDLNSQDSTDEMSPLNENHVPSYIGISCAVSGYSNYSSYTKRPSASPIPRSELGSNSNNNNSNSNNNNNISNGKQAPNRSQTTSPTIGHRNNQLEPHHHQVHHITINKNNIQSPDEERKELTEKLIASATEHRRDPSPIPPTEDDRHHGAYVGARYCPLPPPSKLVNKHIPLLGIDDDQNPDDHVDDGQANKVEQKIANLYGDEFVEDWRESMTHRAKKELPEDHNGLEQQAVVKNPKDLVTLKPTPPPSAQKVEEFNDSQLVDIPIPNAKVLAGVEKQFLNKLLTDENPPTPSPPPYLQSPVKESKTAPTATETTRQEAPIPTNSPVHQVESKTSNYQPTRLPTPPAGSPQLTQETLDDAKKVVAEEIQSATTEQTDSIPQLGSTGKEEHIEYEIRTESPVDNQASPVRIRTLDPPSAEQQQQQQPAAIIEENLVSFTPEPASLTATKESINVDHDEKKGNESEPQQQISTESEINDGRYYLNLLDREKRFILSQVVEAESILSEKESELDEDTTGKIRSAIGKANLLVNKKCNQFKELCESNINANANEQYATLNDDLAGFWDMIRIQIEDVKKSFENIWIAKANNWNSQVEAKVQSVVVADNEPADSSNDSSRESSLKDKISGSSSKPKLSAQKDQERRERLKEHINQMKQNQAAKIEGGSTLIESDDHLEASAVAADDLEQVGCDLIETVVDASAYAANVAATEQLESTNIEANQQQAAEESEEQLFSLMGSISPPPPASASTDGNNQNEEDTAGGAGATKPKENLLDLLD